MYEIYISHAAEIFGVPKTREIFVDRACARYVPASQFADPRSDPDFWNKWRQFEVRHGNEDTFREMLRIKQSVSASYGQTHFIWPEYLMQKDQTVNLDEAKDKLKQAGVL